MSNPNNGPFDNDLVINGALIVILIAGLACTAAWYLVLSKVVL